MLLTNYNNSVSTNAHSKSLPFMTLCSTPASVKYGTLFFTSAFNICPTSVSISKTPSNNGTTIYSCQWRCHPVSSPLFGNRHLVTLTGRLSINILGFAEPDMVLLHMFLFHPVQKLVQCRFVFFLNVCIDFSHIFCIF